MKREVWGGLSDDDKKELSSLKVLNEIYNRAVSKGFASDVYCYITEVLDFDEFIHNLQALETALKVRDSSLPQDLIFVLMVYEPPYKACSERGSIQDWVRSHGWECDELIDFT